MENDFQPKKKFIIEDKTIFYSGLIYFIVMFCFVMVKIFSYWGVFNGMDTEWANRLVSTLIQVGIMFLLPLILYKWLNKTTFKQAFLNFSFKKVNWKIILFSFILGFLVFILTNYLSSFWSGLLIFFGYQFSSSTGGDYSTLAFIFSIITTAMMPGFCEEISHRGLLLGSLKNNGIKRAILISALLFGFMHFNIVQFGYAFVIGLILGLVTAVSRSIFPAMIIHFSNNFLSVLIDFSLNNNWLGSQLINNVSSFFYNGNILLSSILSILILIAVCFGILYFISLIFAQGKLQKFYDFQKNFKEQIKGTEFENEFDTSNKRQMLNLYTQISMLDIQKKLEGGKLNETLMKNISEKPGLIDILLMESELEKKQKPHKADYLFIYCAIFLGAMGTIFIFLWGIM